MGIDARGLGFIISAQLHAIGNGDIREKPGEAVLCIFGNRQFNGRSICSLQVCGKADRFGVSHIKRALGVRFFPVGAKQRHGIEPRSIEARKPGFRGIRNRCKARQVVAKGVNELGGDGGSFKLGRIDGPGDNQTLLLAQNVLSILCFFHICLLQIIAWFG